MRQLVRARHQSAARHEMFAFRGAGIDGRRGPLCHLGQSAYPDLPVIALVGDGAMQMNNMAELITVAKYWREWPNPVWICAVWKNEDLNQVTWEQRVMEGDPKFDASQNIPNVPYHKFAELIGLKGLYVDEPVDVARAWEEALRSDRPVVLEFKTDSNVPPLPPHITLEQAKHFASALLKVDPDESGIIAGAAKQIFAAIRPGGNS